MFITAWTCLTQAQSAADSCTLLNPLRACLSRLANREATVSLANIEIIPVHGDPACFALHICPSGLQNWEHSMPLQLHTFWAEITNHLRLFFLCLLEEKKHLNQGVGTCSKEMHVLQRGNRDRVKSRCACPFCGTRGEAMLNQKSEE